MKLLSLTIAGFFLAVGFGAGGDAYKRGKAELWYNWWPKMRARLDDDQEDDNQSG